MLIPWLHQSFGTAPANVFLRIRTILTSLVEAGKLLPDPPDRGFAVRAVHDVTELEWKISSLCTEIIMRALNSQICTVAATAATCTSCDTSHPHDEGRDGGRRTADVDIL